MLLIHAIDRSQADKTYGLPVTYNTEKDTCPDSCPLREAGCYAKSGNVAIHWRKLNKATEETGQYLTWDRFLNWVKSLRSKQFWRYAVAGDLPHTGDGKTIDGEKVNGLVKANKVGNKKGFTYTHHDPNVGDNAETIRKANEGRFTINLSANNEEEADRLYDLGIGPVVTIMEKNDRGHSTTPKGRKIVECLATNPRVPVKDCAECKFLCQKADRDFIIGFVPHGSQKKKVEKIRQANAENS